MYNILYIYIICIIYYIYIYTDMVMPLTTLVSLASLAVKFEVKPTYAYIDLFMHRIYIYINQDILAKNFRQHQFRGKCSTAKYIF